GQGIALRSDRVRIARYVLAAVLASGCYGNGLVPCGDRFCPRDNVCTPGGCAAPADVAACEGLADGVACKTFQAADGTCAYGACHSDLCGNGKIDPGEVCDGDLGVDPTAAETCSPDCKRVFVCGNGVVDDSEQCDDGNENPA